MAKIVQSWPSTVAGLAEADLVRQCDKRPSNAPFGQAAAVLGDKEAWAVRGAAQTIPACCVIPAYSSRRASIAEPDRVSG